MLMRGLPFIVFVLLVAVAILTGGSTDGTNTAAPGVATMRTIFVVVLSLFVISVTGCFLFGANIQMMG
ncbi:hypothetical protein [Levilactobacillus namurensis]|uniref:Uncharacterized protein n=1 Tax=Levilactobacillus namurensis TaxID=380393 RepID=A0AAW8W451_9LACO|nr:hypothetical protein [Levilactobacillus namurensis]MDT7013569.1 hypothetical protein [Levilactobacillus namurensis]